MAGRRRREKEQLSGPDRTDPISLPLTLPLRGAAEGTVHILSAVAATLSAQACGGEPGALLLEAEDSDAGWPQTAPPSGPLRAPGLSRAAGCGDGGWTGAPGSSPTVVHTTTFLGVLLLRASGGKP